MKKEADPLVKGSNGDAARSRTSSYGAVPENAGDPVEVTIKDGKDKSDEKPPLPPVGLCQMFRYATIGDVFLMMLGTIFSIVHGAGWPAVNFIFGGMTDTMVGSGVNTTGLNVTNGSYLPEFEDKMNNTSLYYVYVACGVLVAAYCQTSFWQWTCERQIYRMRKKFFESLLRQTIGWYDHHQSGELTTRLADDLERVREGMGEKVAMLTQMLAAFATGFGMAFYKNWSMTLVMMAMTPLLIIGGAAISIAVSKLAKKEQEIYASAGAVAEEVLSCAKTVMSFNGQLKEVLRYDKALIGAQKAGVRKGLLTGGSLAFTFMVLYGSYALAFWYGAKLVGDGGISPGDVFTVFFCVMIGSFSLGNMAPSVTAVSTARGAAAKVFEVIDNIPEIDSTSTQGTWLQDLRGDIKFSGVSFAYPTRPDVPVLKDVSLEVKSGQKVAIVGSSGCGKSTIVNLILRFYDPLAGKIYIDGSEVKSLCLRWLRQNIGVVSQEPVLFGCSIADNIRMGRENVTMEEIEAVAKLANAHNFVSKLPAKYSTIVGERGAQLSGGQKQRIAIARALIRNPKILLLDEATSALDSESESAVQSALEEASKGRTTIIIAHRLSTIRNADFIIALDKGEVAEVGSHDELMEREGVYHQLVTLQNFKDEATGAVEEFVNPTLAMKRQASVKSTEGDSKNEKEVDEDVPIPPYCRILSLNKPEVHLILLGTLGTILVGAAMPAFSVVFSQIIYIFRDFEMSKNRPTLDREAIFWSMMYLVLGGATALGNMTSLGMFSVSGERMTRRLRLAAFKNILRQDLEYFEDPKHSTGALTTKLATEASLVRAATGIRIATVLQACVTMSAGLVIAFVYGWKLAFAILACVPIMALAGTVHMKVLSGNQKRDSQLLEDAGKTAGEAIENIRTVVALAREDKFYRDYCERLIAPHRESTKQAQIYGIAWGLSQSITFFMYAGAFRFGAWLIVQGEMNPEDVYRVIFAIAFSALAVGQGMSFLPDFSKAKLAAGHIFNILDRKPKIDSYSENGQMIHDVKGDISFQRVFFSYPRRQEVTVMKGINLDIPHGQTLALVGPSGCGKSTVVSLLQRLYDISDGEITIDGVDIRHLNVHWLRSLISVVSQEPILFNCSIEENVKYGVDDLSTVNHDDVIAVCKQANIHEFVMSLPKRYETLVGEKGTQLSGGQKQRLAIARALLRRPRILLLDEATSALDTESEKLVQAALDVAREGRTCIVVAHRLSTIQNADVIAVVEDGCIVEMGSHQELLNRKGAYFSLINGQRNIVT